MSAWDYLSAIERTDAKIQENLELIEILWTNVTNISISYDKETVQSSKDPDKESIIVAKIVELEKSNDELSDFLGKRKESCKEIIKKMSDWKEKEVLFLKFFEYQSNVDISCNTNFNCTPRHVGNIVEKALKSFEAVAKTQNIVVSGRKNTKKHKI